MATKRPTGAYSKASKKANAKRVFEAKVKSGKIKVLQGEVITPGSAVRLGAKVLTAVQKAAVKRAVRENVAEKTAQRVGAKANPMRRAVSSKDAKSVAKETVGKYPAGRPGRMVPKPGTGLSRSERARVSVKQPVKREQRVPLKKQDADRMRAMERNSRLKEVLTPIKPRGVAAGGKSVAGPKPSPRQVTVAKPSAATTRAKQVNPKDRKMDASRREAMRDAANDSRNVFRPARKTPAQRELEQRNSSRDHIGSSSGLSNPQMREADRRVAEGLKAIKEKEKANRLSKVAKKPRIKRSA
jgi:hypothetical protein